MSSEFDATGEISINSVNEPGELRIDAEVDKELLNPSVIEHVEEFDVVEKVYNEFFVAGEGRFDISLRVPSDVGEVVVRDATVELRVKPCLQPWKVLAVCGTAFHAV